MLPHHIYLLQEWGVEIVVIKEDYGFVAVVVVAQGPQLVADHHFEHFVESADSAREGDECVAVGNEVLLALGH